MALRLCGVSTRLIAWPGNGFQTESILPLTLRSGGGMSNGGGAGAFAGGIHKSSLGMEDFAVARDGGVSPVGMEFAGFGIIFPMPIENFIDTVAGDGIFDWETGLHPTIEIAGHPIGAREKNLGLAAIFKTVDSAVFEVLADDATDLDGIANAGDARAEAADAADDEADGDAGLGGLVEGLDDF